MLFLLYWFYFFFVTLHFPSNRARLLLLYLRIKWPHTLITPMIRNSRTFALLLSLLAWWAVKILLHIPLWHVSTGFNRNFCIAHNTLCLRSGLCNNFFSISPGVTVVPRQIEAQAYAEFGGGQTRCIMGNAKVVNGYLMLIINRTAKEHEWSDPRKWEKNQGQTRTFDSRSGRGRKPRKRYV